MSETVELSEAISAELDADQAAAVRAFGPMTLVVAGAGSGKTRVLTYGLAHLLDDHGFEPEQLMLLTFTRKAAENMRARAAEVAGRDLGEMPCGTFHAVGANMLRQLGRDFTIIDEDEAVLTVAQIGSEMAQDRAIDGYERMQPDRLAGWFSQVREEGVELRELLFDAPEYYKDRRELIEEIYEAYMARKVNEGLLDYADILWETRETLTGTDGATVRAELRAVLVDEVQDLNQIQRDIAELLTADGAWLIQCGDMEQSIYGFRGASYESLLEQAKNPAVSIAKLHVNYRCSPEIVELSRRIVPASPLALDIKPQRPSQHQTPELIQALSAEDEAELLIDWAEDRLARGANLESLCVLARAHDQVHDAARIIDRLGYPYALLGRRSDLFTQCRTLLTACMRLAHDPRDRGGWQKLLPNMGIEPEEQFGRLRYLIDEAENPLLEAAGWCAFSSYADLLRMLDGQTPSGLLWQALLEGPFLWILSAGLEEERQLQAIITGLLNIGTVPLGDGRDYLTQLALVASDERLGAGIRLGTIHAAKGLEWPHVMLWRCSYPSFPSRQALAEHAYDEERRLFYVAVTRAEDTLTLCEAPYRRKDGQGRHSMDFLSDREILASVAER